VVLALLCLVAAKVANLGVPLLLKHLVDAMNLPASDPRALLVVPAGLLLAYAALRLSASLFTELRELVFAKATQAPRARSRCRSSATCTRCRCASTWNARPAA
jgi:ATP-binding cassette subfamily B protein